jgi:hypothetical protein
MPLKFRLQDNSFSLSAGRITKGRYDPGKHKPSEDTIPCYDPGSMVYLDTMAADDAHKVFHIGLLENLWASIAGFGLDH